MRQITASALLVALSVWAGASDTIKEEPVQAAAPQMGTWARKLARTKERLESGEVLLEETFDRKDLGERWIAEEGTWQTAQAAGQEGAGVVGAPGTKYPDSFLWTKASFKGDIAVEFDAVCQSDPAHDINFVICGKAPNYPPPEKPLYLFGLGGWENTMTGVERAPDYKWRALTGLFTIAKDTRYHVLAGRLGGYFYLFVDGKLVVEARDRDPLPAEGQFAFHVYRSTVRFENLVIRKPGK